MSETAPPAPTLAEALRFWLKLGFISFGGPAGQIALMHAELVERRRWLSDRRFVHALNYCMLLPGPEAQQLATYLGWLLHRTAGGIAAGALFVLPSLLILIGCATVYQLAGDQPLVHGLLAGIRPAVLALVIHAAWRLGTRLLNHPARMAMAAAAFVAVAWAKLPFPLVVALAAAIGWLSRTRWPAAFAGSTPGHGKPGAGSHAPAVIDDHTPPPPHARFSARRLAFVLGVGALLWVVPVALLAVATRSSPGLGVLQDMALFFSKAALLTFGGAYAVLPYVHEGAVTQFGWLSSQQMIDGLALGETTPGPLIMVVTFVGFVGGWQNAPLVAALGGQHPWLAGALAACVVTAFTFLPSFVFILAGGPLVEATPSNTAFSAPLAAIGAAVVGVIASFALHLLPAVVWPQGMASGLDPWALALTLAAAVALLRGTLGAPGVIIACGLAGLLLNALR